ncbi:MAG: phosphoglycerate kinase [Alphaproteobacteria bacterium]
MSQFKTIDDLDVAGMRVLVRADLNVPMKDGKITDTTRIDRTVPTLTELSNKGALVVVMTHFGRPKGEVVPDLSLAPVAKALSEAVGQPVRFATDTVGENARLHISEMGEGEIVMLENLRFNRGEEENDKAFTLELSKLGDCYVSDAFSCSHRAHASTEGLAHLLPAAAGRLMQVEVESLAAALENPTPPVAAVVGGAKVSTKMDVLGNLASKVDVLIIGGGMANTFLFAQGIDVGNSLCEKDMADQARGILEAAEKSGCDVVLPVDAVVAREFKEGADCETVELNAIPSDAMMLDIGPKSIALVEAKLETCKTLVWNGPFGAFEIPPFDKGTNAAAQVAARLTREGKLVSVAGGGDTVAALAHAGVSDDFTYISTAGGAFLEWMEGKKLPGVEVLRK